MVRSMTGYGRGGAEEDGLEITVQLRCVNSRYLDVNVRMPRDLGMFEDKTKKKAAGYVSRGKLDVFIHIEKSSAPTAQISLNREFLETYMEALKEITVLYPQLPNDISVMRIAANRDVFNVSAVREDEERLWALLERALDGAFAELEGMRLFEGERMCADIRARAEECARLTGEIEKLTSKTAGDYYTAFLERVKELTGNAPLDENRLITEAAIYADKMSVSEETVRAKSHYAQLEQILNEKVPVGRKLDFLIQEINREVNTIGSKTDSLEAVKLVVEMKSELEKIREQVQNIE